MQQEEAQKNSAWKMVMRSYEIICDMNRQLGIDVTREMDASLTERMSPILKDGSDETLLDAFIMSCKGGFRLTAMDMIRSGCVRLDGMDPIIVLGLLEECSITADVLPEGPFREKMMRAQKVRRIFGK